MPDNDPESARLAADARREANWKRWGPYLPARQWGTVREDYSPDGTFWDSFPHDHARSRAYRWGEDGLLGVCDRECRLCLAPALWNGRDPFLKERLFGLTGLQGNHSEDVKEAYFYLDATPTHSYLKALYKYPQVEFPYDELLAENKRLGRGKPEYELADTGAFDGDRYWDVFVEYAKAGPDDLLIQFTAANRGPEAARLWLLPTVWFRNTWAWGSRYEEGRWAKPRLTRLDGGVLADHETLGRFRLAAEPGPGGPPEWVFTENETNRRRHPDGLLGGLAAAARAAVVGDRPSKDAFHEYVVAGWRGAVSYDGGTKASAVYVLDVPAGGEVRVRLRLTAEADSVSDPFADFDRVFADRKAEADAFYAARLDPDLRPAERAVARQAYAALLWQQQFYHYVVPDWVMGDANEPLPKDVQEKRRNTDWRHLFAREVVSVPDKWEYPAFFAWDLGFQAVSVARIDPDFAKGQLALLLREWYLHPNGQIPAFDYDLGNVNPPVHAWACWEVYLRSGRDDIFFLKRVFSKLLLNFNWWVNRKDAQGRNLFQGGFLGLDNLGVFDRSKPLPGGGHLEQADGTAWMGFFCTCMLAMSVELARHDPAYEDMASKFFEHFVQIAEALNTLGGEGLWQNDDQFYYDRVRKPGEHCIPLRVRSVVGLVPLLAVYHIGEEAIHADLPGFEKRMLWFFENRKDELSRINCLEEKGEPGRRRILLALPSRDQLRKALAYVLDEAEFLAPHGVRSLSKYHERHPFVYKAGWFGGRHEVGYVPGDMDTPDFGGNSNWRGAVWFSLNFLLIQALREYHRFYGDDFTVECPTGSGRVVNLAGVADELCRRLTWPLLPGADGRRPYQGAGDRWAGDPQGKDYVLFPEYFDGDTGRGLGARHLGWTTLAADLLQEFDRGDSK
jgi:hypothetical protein